MKRSAIAAVVLSLAGVGSVWSQQEQPSRWVPYPDPLGSLRVADIQSKLGLSDDQKAAVKQLEAEWLEVWKALQKSRPALSVEEFAAKRREAEKPFAAKARDLLSDRQQEELREIRRLQRAELFSPLRKLRRQELQTELALDEDQKQAIEALHQQWIEEIRPLEDLVDNVPPGKTWFESDYARAVFRAQREFQPRVRSLSKQILRRPQLARLRQIEWQEVCYSEGAAVLVRSQMATYLGLTDEQQRSIRTLADESGRKQRELQRAGEHGSELAERREALHQALARLTVIQRFRWNAMIGKSYGYYKSVLEESGRQEDEEAEGANKRSRRVQ